MENKNKKQENTGDTGVGGVSSFKSVTRGTSVEENGAGGRSDGVIIIRGDGK